jgi:hypothetical protein
MDALRYLVINLPRYKQEKFFAKPRVGSMKR